MRGDVTDAGRTNDDDEQLKIELLSQWKLEAESRKKSQKVGRLPFPPSKTYNQHASFCDVDPMLMTFGF